MIPITHTQRGFAIGEFTDRYNKKCKIQKSSLATEDCIWLGITEPRLTVFEDEKKGKYLETDIPKNWSVDSIMHLTREQVAELLPILQAFVETGEID
jgi:hypothetical protein